MEQCSEKASKYLFVGMECGGNKELIFITYQINSLGKINLTLSSKTTLGITIPSALALELWQQKLFILHITNPTHTLDWGIS